MKFIIYGKLPNLNNFISAYCKNRYAGNKLKRDTQDTVCHYIRLAKLKPIHCRVHMKYTFYEPNTRRDLDNIFSFCAKVTQDALVELGILENDGWKNIAGFSTEFKIDKVNPRIEIELIKEN